MEKDAQAGEPEEEEVDDELSSTDLYEDSMAEVTLNETRGGHVSWNRPLYSHKKMF